MASIRKLVLATLLPLALISPSAHAAEDVAVIQGQGSITPGLPTSGCAFQSVTFSGTAVAASDHGESGVYNVSFSGNSTICETLAAGQGSGTLSGDVSGTVAYSRTGPYVTISGQGSLRGTPHVIVRGDCYFVPVTIHPVTVYVLVCDVYIRVTT